MEVKKRRKNAREEMTPEEAAKRRRARQLKGITEVDYWNYPLGNELLKRAWK